MIGYLIWILGSAGIDGTIPEKKKKIDENPDIVIQNLNAINAALSIQFLPEPPKFELCIHNSENDVKAVCYLRVPGTKNPVQFIKWCEGDAAAKLAKAYLDLRKQPPTESIFRSTINFDLDVKKEYANRLCGEIVSRFPSSIKSKISNVCFPPPPEPTPRRG
jgi:hypothetical protein